MKSKNELVQAILDPYQPETAKDVDALKDFFNFCLNPVTRKNGIYR